MYLIKRFFILMMMAAIFITAIAAQNTRREMTVEESYLQESIENMIIRETARTESREQKMIALDYIKEAMDRGNKSDDIRQTLEFLAQEGRRTVVIENGRVINNFPEVRRRAVIYLGQMKTKEASNALIDIIQIENEPIVIQEVIKSLGDIGINDNNSAISSICWVVGKFDNLKPDNLIAVATIDTFEKLIKQNSGYDKTEAIQILLRISTGLYIKPVQERAKQALADIRRIGN